MTDRVTPGSRMLSGRSSAAEGDSPKSSPPGDHTMSPFGLCRHLASAEGAPLELDAGAVLAQLPWAYLVHDQAKVCYANQAAAALFGYDGPADLVGRPLAELVAGRGVDAPPERGTLWDNAVVDAAEPRQVSLLCADGRRIDAEAELASVRADGEIYTGLRLSRCAPGPSTQHLPLGIDSGIESILEVSPDFVMLITPSGQIKYLNRTNGRVPLERFVGSSIFDLPRGPYVPLLRACIDRVLETGKVDQCELEYQNQFHENRRFETRVGPVYRAGRIVALALNCRDVTDHRPREPQPMVHEIPVHLPVTPSVPGPSSTCERSTIIRQGQRLEFETLLAELSIELKCRTREENIDQLVLNVLRNTAQFLGAGRGLLLQFLPDGDLLECTHQWGGNHDGGGIAPPVPSPSGYEWLAEHLRGGVPYVTGQVEDLLEQGSADRDRLLRRNVRSLVALPLCLECRPIGALCFEADGSVDPWDDASIARLGIIGGLIVNAIVRLQTMTALRRAHHELQHVTASVSAGLWSLRVAPDGRWHDHYRSPVMENITGRTAEFYGHSPQRWLATVHEDDRSAVMDVLQRLLRSAPTHDEIEYRIVLPDGSVRWVRNSTNARRLPDDSIRLDGVLADITDRKRAEAAARENEEQRRRLQDELAHAGRLSTLGELVASIAHEINQPLYAITNYAGACRNALDQRSESALERITEWVNEIGAQTRRAGLIISRLGDFVRKAPPHREPLNVNTLVIDSLDLLGFETRTSHIRVHLDLAPVAPYVMADRVQIQQVIVNLLRNAFDAMEDVSPDERRVQITIERDNQSAVMVHVRDRGKGLTPDEYALLFEPFFTTKQNGMGIGLSISRSIIEAHGGRLWATRHDDVGATFHFELPILREQPEGTPESDAAGV